MSTCSSWLRCAPMKASWTVARVAGVAIRVHATFLLLLLWIGASEWITEGTLAGALAGVGFAALIFASVVLHEFGHAFVARRFGIKTLDITLLPIGGVARLEKIPTEPRAELLVALGGPAVNVVLVAGLAAVALLAGLPIGPPDVSGDPQLPIVVRLLWVNAALALFNMIPAFPMDGGRVLRAVLSMRLDHRRATRVAAAVGQTLAFMLGFLGLFGSPLLVFVALFVWLGAAAEVAGEELHAALAGLSVADAMTTRFEALAPEDTLGAAAARAVHLGQTSFPVVVADGLVGVLGHDPLIVGLAERGAEALVGSVMDREPARGSAREALEGALNRMQEAGKPIIVVVDGRRVVGLLTPASVGELVALRGALLRHAPGGAAATGPTAPARLAPP